MINGKAFDMNTPMFAATKGSLTLGDFGGRHDAASVPYPRYAVPHSQENGKAPMRIARAGKIR
jgi:blue copper oxidase